MSLSDESQRLADFIARHSKPYDPETDNYDRPPFAADIKEGKNDPIYNAHSYHTKVPPRGIVPYILHYTEPGDLILDPFCGSGMTGVAAQLCTNPPADILQQFPELKGRVGPRACILNDLSPAACHIAYNYNTPVDVEAFKREFERIKAAVKQEFDWLYGTEHYEPAVDLYDPANPDVAGQLKNLPGGKTKQTLLDRGECTWELLNKADVEGRLGYPGTELARDERWGDLDVAKIERWVCIPATIQYTIWSDVYRCEGFVTIEEPTGKISSRGKNAGKPITRKRAVARGCGAEIVLWHAMANPDENKAETANLCCPKCHQMWEKVDLPFVRIIPIAADYTFKNPNGLRRRERRKVTTKESRSIAEATPERWHVWFPQHQIYPYRELMTMSANKRGIITTADFYTRRNLAALGLLWSEINTIVDEGVRTFARFAFTAIIPYCCRKQNYGGGGGGMSGTLYLPSFHQEKNVWSVFERKVSKLIDEFRGREHLFSNVVVLKRSASEISIADQSVDYIFADPPFGGNIFYSDASILWESWLDDFTNEAAEMVYHRRSRQHRRRDGYTFKTIEDYSNDMALAFAEMFRVLKPGRWATIEFNNSDGLVFEAIKGAIRKAGFEIANMLLFDKAQKSFKQVKGATGEEDVVDKDVVFNLHKPAFAASENRREEHDLEQQVAEAIRQHLLTLPERIKTDPSKYNDEHRTTATINSMLMNTLIPRGVSVYRLNLPVIERICARYFRRIGQHWYLRGEAVGSNGEGTLIADEISIRDEVTAIAWLRQKLESGRPMLIGELKPLWMRATGLLTTEVSQGLVLENLLSENFWRDSDTNRWREPTSEERERMNDDRSLRVLHDAERFVSGTLNRSTTDEERCKWIDVLFQACRAIEDNEVDALPALRGFDKAEAYGIITRLFQSVLRDHVSKETYERASKQGRAASQRIAKQVQEENEEQLKAKVGSDTNQGRFDFDKST